MKKNDEELASCDENCRRRQGCKLDYSVNEYQMLCNGYDIQYIDSWRYYWEALQNPWVTYFDSDTLGKVTT